MDNTILSIIGSNSSGKTTAAIKIALSLANKGKNVVLVFCDQFVPPAAYVLPSSLIHSVSLGTLLTNNHITQDDVLSAMVSINKNLSVLGYTKNENALDYPSITTERVNELIAFIRPLAEYIIFDCSCIFEIDRLSYSSMQQADKILKLITPDLKGITFEQSNKKHIDESFNEKTFTAISLVEHNLPFEMAGELVGASSTLNIEFEENLAKQMRECTLLESDNSTTFDNILRECFGIYEAEQPESQNKKLGRIKPKAKAESKPVSKPKPKPKPLFMKKEKNESRDEF